MYDRNTFFKQSKARKIQIIKNSFDKAYSMFNKDLSLYEIEIFVEIEEHVYKEIYNETFQKLEQIKELFIKSINNERIYNRTNNSFLANFDLWIIDEYNYKPYAKSFIIIILKYLHKNIEFKIIKYYQKEIIKNGKIIYRSVHKGLCYTKEEYNKLEYFSADDDIAINRLQFLNKNLEKIKQVKKCDLDYLFIQPFLYHGYSQARKKSLGDQIKALVRLLSKNKILKISEKNVYKKIDSFPKIVYVDVIKEYNLETCL